MRKVFIMDKLKDAELMERIALSDEYAFKTLFDRYWKSMYALAFSFLDNESSAKDVVQEVWGKFWELRKKIKNENVKAYLYQSVRHKVFNHLRNTKKFNLRLEILDNYISDNNIKDKMDLDDLQARLDNAINKLPARNKMIFLLSRYEGKFNKEISMELGISKRTVENHITNALQSIRKEIIVVFMLLPGIM
ncbi:MAG: RNA polymerase sigma-70 factor [Bacteroidota bacterium]